MSVSVKQGITPTKNEKICAVENQCCTHKIHTATFCAMLRMLSKSPCAEVLALHSETWNASSLTIQFQHKVFAVVTVVATKRGILPMFTSNREIISPMTFVDNLTILRSCHHSATSTLCGGGFSKMNS